MLLNGVLNAQPFEKKYAAIWNVQPSNEISNEKYLHAQQNVYFLRVDGRSLPDKSGVKILKRLSRNEFIVFVGEKESKSEWTELLKHALPVNHLWKLNQDLLNSTQHERSRFVVRCAAPEKLGIRISKLSDVRLISVKSNLIIVETSLGWILDHLIFDDDILYVGREELVPHLESRVLDLNLGPNQINMLHDEIPSLDGIGLTISFKELLYDVNDLDLQGRDVPSSRNAPVSDNHATDMATLAAGAGNSFITGRGVARNAFITSSDYADLFPDDQEYFTTLNASVQNHSYGTKIENFYGALAEAYDQETFEHPEILHVFSSGNDGLISSSSGLYQNVDGYANLTGNFKQSKNTLAVGAVDTTGTPIAFGSKGPAYDGRVKPEVVAYSTAGTSNAAALVSGVSLLMQQSFKQEHGDLPASALVKAILINSAKDVGPEGVDFATGYGNIDAYRAVMQIKSGQYFEGTVNASEVVKIPITVPANAMNLKISLVWNDPAASPNAFSALVNDLDLRLVNNTTTVLPWTLNSEASLVALQEIAARKEDHLNNVEQITLGNVEPGSYDIEVEGFSVTEAQRFFIVWQWDEKESFLWRYPTASDNMPYNGETTSYFYWKSTFEGQTGRLEYSIDNGLNWNLIDDNIDLSNELYRWDVTPELNSKAQARMIIGEDVFPTAYFTISKPLNIQTGFNCGDSVMLKWPRVTTASAYRIYNYQSLFMQAVTETPDTAFILKKSDFGSRYFAIEPLLVDGTELLRSPTVDYESLGTECYISSLIDESRSDGIYLTLQLGTTYGVEKINFERDLGAGFVIIGTVLPGDDSNPFGFLDESPNQGLNEYRARVELQNGQSVYSEVIENFYISEAPFFIFPNPVSGTQDLQIFSKISTDTEFVFKLFKTDGTLLVNTTLYSDREFIPMRNFPAGLYLYEIVTSEGKFRGKIVRTENQ